MLRSCLTNGGEPRNREIFHMKEIVSEVGVENLTTQKVIINSKGEISTKRKGGKGVGAGGKGRGKLRSGNWQSGYVTNGRYGKWEMCHGN